MLRSLLEEVNTDQRQFTTREHVLIVVISWLIYALQLELRLIEPSARPHHQRTRDLCLVASTDKGAAMSSSLFSRSPSLQHLCANLFTSECHDSQILRSPCRLHCVSRSAISGYERSKALDRVPGFSAMTLTASTQLLRAVSVMSLCCRMTLSQVASAPRFQVMRGRCVRLMPLRSTSAIATAAWTPDRPVPSSSS